MKHHAVNPQLTRFAWFLFHFLWRVPPGYSAVTVGAGTLSCYNALLLRAEDLDDPPEYVWRRYEDRLLGFFMPSCFELYRRVGDGRYLTCAGDEFRGADHYIWLARCMVREERGRALAALKTWSDS